MIPATFPRNKGSSRLGENSCQDLIPSLQVPSVELYRMNNLSTIVKFKQHNILHANAIKNTFFGKKQTLTSKHKSYYLFSWLAYLRYSDLMAPPFGFLFAWKLEKSTTSLPKHHAIQSLSPNILRYLK